MLAIAFFTPFFQNAGEQKTTSMRIRIRTDIKADNIIFIKTENVLPRLVIANHLMSSNATNVNTLHSVSHSYSIPGDINQTSPSNKTQPHKTLSFEEKTKKFDTYIDHKIEILMAQETDQKTLQVKTWQQLCQCIKLNRDSKKKYQCPFSTCINTDSSRFDNIASCYLTHFDKNFFRCPNCAYICAKFSVLKTHFIYECHNTLESPVQPAEKQIESQKNSFTHKNTIMIENSLSFGSESQESSVIFNNELPKPKLTWHYLS